MQPAESVEFDYDAVEAADTGSEEIAFRMREGACALLALLTSGGASPKVIGKRALALQHALKAGPFRNQRELAKRMGVTQARASQILSEVTSVSARVQRNN